jgi:hypothetical protein
LLLPDSTSTRAWQTAFDGFFSAAAAVEGGVAADGWAACFGTVVEVEAEGVCAYVVVTRDTAVNRYSTGFIVPTMR